MAQGHLKIGEESKEKATSCFQKQDCQDYTEAFSFGAGNFSSSEE